MEKGIISWITDDEQYHEQRYYGISTGIQFFIKLYFQTGVKNINFKRVD